MVAASCVFVPVALASLQFGWGIVGVWVGIAALIAVRLATCGARFASRRWAVAGAWRTAPEGS
jgi:Na+-driven multidrug efflux pump